MPRKKQYQWDVETNGQEAPEQLSRSAKKRQSSALQDLGAELTKLPVNELDRLPLTPDLLEALRLYTRISNREGKRRQLQFIGRLMREVDAGPLAEAIEARKNGQQADAARLHLAEQWREKLLSAAEADMEDLLAAFPWPDAEAAGRPELEKLLAFVDDDAVLSELTAVKKANKEALADWLLHTQKVRVNTDAVFDIQSKRLHEYKRQQLNLLYLIHQYYEIKAGHLPAVPLVSIFGAKAAPAYTIAKDIIHALLTLSKVIAADPEVSKWLQVVFVENYNVTAAEKLIPACDLSEQISLASKEASGTGNMKFMLNGALTLGTMDGANVEISQQVGEENIYIFGQTSDQVIHRYAVGDYDPAQWVEGDANIRRAISFLTGPEMLAAGHAENLTRLHDELIHKDWFQTLPDFNAYVVRKGQALSDYACDPTGWRRKCLVNIAKAGMFSSDRTIAEYDRDIWHLGK